MSDPLSILPGAPQRPDAAPPPRVDGAFLALDLALHAAGGEPNADIKRVTAFRETVRAVGKRWKDGDPAPVMRAKKAVVAQPGAAEPEPEHAPEAEG